MASLNREQQDVDDKGQLIERGFYIESRDYTLLNVLSVSIVIMFVIQMILFARILSGSNKNEYWLIGLLTMPIAIFLIGLIGETRYAFRLNNGDLDWDLYENGIMTKKWNPYDMGYRGDVVHLEGRSLPSEKKLEERFIRFEDVARVYLNKDDKFEEYCYHIFLDYLNKISPVGTPRIKDNKSLLASGMRHYIQNAVFLEGKDGNLLCMPMYKKNIKNFQGLEKVLLQKVKDI